MAIRTSRWRQNLGGPWSFAGWSIMTGMSIPMKTGIRTTKRMKPFRSPTRARLPTRSETYEKSYSYLSSRHTSRLGMHKQPNRPLPGQALKLTGQCVPLSSLSHPSTQRWRRLNWERTYPTFTSQQRRRSCAVSSGRLCRKIGTCVPRNESEHNECFMVSVGLAWYKLCLQYL